jgi:hypothetical protein
MDLAFCLHFRSSAAFVCGSRRKLLPIPMPMERTTLREFFIPSVNDCYNNDDNNYHHHQDKGKTSWPPKK